MKNELIGEFKKLGIKSRDMRRLLHAFEIIEIVAFNINKNVTEIFSAYEISKIKQEV